MSLPVGIRVFPLLVFCCLLGSTALCAQADADSARVAREAWRQAAPLYQHQEWAAARALVRRAFEAWPAQQAYVYAYAALSARVADTAETIRALDRLADLGLARDLFADPDFAALRDAPALGPVLRRITQNAAPLVRSTVAATLAEADLFPEGMSHDARQGVWYVASVRHRKVVRIRRDGTVEDFIHEGQDGLWAALGVRADPGGGTLWVTTAAIPQMAGYVAADSGRAGVYAFDLATGRLKARYLLPTAPPGHLLGDLVVAPNGDVYATDSQDPVVWRIVRGGKRIEEFLRHPLFRSLQGPAVDPLGRTLYLADYSHGILAVDLASRTVRALPAPAGATTLGIDGMVWHAGTLIGVQNGVTPPRIVRLVLDRVGLRIERVEVLDRNLEVATEPTIGTVWGDRYYYVANSQWDEYDAAGRPKPGARLAPAKILEIRLR